jgi:pilus assembly protein CpaE
VTRAGHIVAVYSPAGGVGKTTLATNMAAALMREDTRVLLVDCDLEFGDVDIFLYLQATHNIIDLAKAADDLDPDLVENVLVTHGSGLKALLTPPHLEDVDEAGVLTGEAIEQVVEKLAPNFDFTVLDMRVRLLDKLAAKLFNLADRIVLVATPTLPAIKSCRQVLKVLDSEYAPEKMIFVMNRVPDSRDRSGALALEDIEKSLKHAIDVRIPLDEKTVITAVNQGVPVVAKNRNKSPAREMIELAEFVRRSLQPQPEGRMSEAKADRSGSRLGRRFG